MNFDFFIRRSEALSPKKRNFISVLKISLKWETNKKKAREQKENCATIKDIGNDDMTLCTLFCSTDIAGYHVSSLSFSSSCFFFISNGMTLIKRNNILLASHRLMLFFIDEFRVD